jgi:hypothetical protein
MSEELSDHVAKGQMLRRRWVQLLLCCGLLLAVLWLVRVRYARSHNFDPIHVQLAGDEWRDCRVFYQSIYGSWGQLMVDERYPNRWIQSPSVNGVVQVLVECPGDRRITGESVEVRAGSSWGIARVVPQLREANAEVLPAGVRDRWTCLEFSPPVTSLIPLAQGTINWQGDLWLLLVPVVQVLTLGGAGLSWLCLVPVRRWTRG